MSSIKMSLVVAMNNSNRGIGVNGRIPWRLPTDMKHFARVTTHTQDASKQNAVIMGRLTWLSIPKSHRPLPNRLNVVISSQLEPNSLGPDVLLFKSFDQAVDSLVNDYSNKIENIFAIGGSQIYRSALANPIMSRIYLTRVFFDCQCDTFMEPENFLDHYRKLEDVPHGKENFAVEFNKTLTENNIDFVFEVYERD